MPRFVTTTGSYCRGSSAASVLPSGAKPKHQNRRRLLRVAAFECGIDEVPESLREQSRSIAEI